MRVHVLSVGTQELGTCMAWRWSSRLLGSSLLMPNGGEMQFRTHRKGRKRSLYAR